MSFTIFIILLVTSFITVLFFFKKRIFVIGKLQKEKPSDANEILASSNKTSVRRRSRIVSRRDQPLHTSNNDKSSCSTVPRSVNYHFTRQCNYKCGFCFHTAKTSFVLPLEKAKQGLKMLKDAGKQGGPGPSTPDRSADLKWEEKLVSDCKAVWLIYIA